MQFKITEKQMTFENEYYVTQMIINSKGEGHDRGESRLRCAVAITLCVKDAQKKLNLRANIYWDTKYPKSHIFFTGGSLVNFIRDQGYNYNDFKECWGKVKRLASNVFTDDEILEYQKKMLVNS
ncbi:hypothetical protein P4654_27140 [Niallia taxi]|uniref:hypothetical protein n=1 Tax=Niallia taxi TaxID=2499688 RepID=UPI002E24348F|nr:hypothetical protein [Niallia taxi]MED4122328.1 hypothetical protein [Niallia taxi]